MKTAEDIIIAKRFFELTPSERELVKELASNEEDYEAMRWFLTSTGETFTQEKITPSPDLRKGVMAHLQQKQTAQRTIWLNGVGAFLFPSEKKFFQYPALQIAAVAALVVSVVLVYENNNPVEQNLAVNDPVAVSNPEESVINEPEVLPIQNADGNQQNDLLPAEKTIDSDTRDNLSGEEAALADDEYYREMSVAEEVKYIEKIDALESGAGSDFSPPADNSTVSTVSGTAITTDSKITTQGELRQETGKKESDGSRLSGKDKNAKMESADADDPNRTTGNELGNIVAPAGYTSTTTVSTEVEEREDDGGLYKTATVGGVYGDTASDSVTTKKPDAEEQARKKYSVTDSKILKKLFFNVK